MPPQVGTVGRAGLVIQGVLNTNPVCPAYQPRILGKAVNFSELPFPCKMDLIISKGVELLRTVAVRKVLITAPGK